jgi:hypothetical protein
MNYSFLLVGQPRSDTIATALAECLHVPVAEVDVADVDGDPDARNWDALVSCEYSIFHGDVSMALDIYAQDGVSNAPNETELGQSFAARVQTVVLFPPTESEISAHWLASPEGIVSRARVVPSDDSLGYTVEAVEAPIRQLPRARAMHLPEVVREQRIATPVADAFTAAFEALPLSQYGTTDPTAITKIADTARDARSYLGAWEKLVQRIASAWQPSGWYPSEFYVENLEYRNQIQGFATDLMPAVASLLADALEQLDQRFNELTVEDTEGIGEAASQAPVPAEGRAWWWRRRPEPLPWTDA